MPFALVVRVCLLRVRGLQSSLLSQSEAMSLGQNESAQEQQQRTVDTNAASFDTFPSLATNGTSINSAQTVAPAAPPASTMNEADPWLAGGAGAGTGAGAPGGLGEPAAESASLTSAAGRGHSTGTEGHIPAPEIAVTRDVTNPFTDEAAAAQLNASAASQPARIGIDPKIITSQLPPPTHGEDAKLGLHLSQVAADLKAQAGFIGQHVAVGARTAGLQTKDAWIKLKHKVQVRHTTSMKDEEMRIARWCHATHPCCQPCCVCLSPVPSPLCAGDERGLSAQASSQSRLGAEAARGRASRVKTLTAARSKPSTGPSKLVASAPLELCFTRSRPSPSLPPAAALLPLSIVYPPLQLIARNFAYRFRSSCLFVNSRMSVTIVIQIQPQAAIHCKFSFQSDFASSAAADAVHRSARHDQGTA